METGVSIKVGACSQMNCHEETGVHINADAGLQFIYHLEISIHKNPDGDFHFIRAYICLEVLHWSAMGHGDGHGCLEFQKDSLMIFNEGSSLQVMMIPSPRLLKMGSSSGKTMLQ